MLPNLVITPDGELFKENGLLEHLTPGVSADSLPERLIHSLKSGDAASFRRFCAASFDFDDDTANYVLYPLVGKRFIPYRFAFCEKILLNEIPVTVVFFTDHIDELHSKMSPASSICRDLTGMLIHDLLCLRSKRRTNFITPEALMVFGDFPLIAHAAENQSPDGEPYCDIHTLTSRVFDGLSESEAFQGTEFVLEDNRDTASHGTRPSRQPIVSCPIEAFVYITAILSYVFAAISDDHRITSRANYFGQGAEVSLRTKTTRADAFASGSSNAEDFCRSSKHLASLARVATMAALSFDIRLDLSYDSTEQTLSVTLGIGYESAPVPVEFHYSDPYAAVAALLREVSALFSA